MPKGKLDTGLIVKTSTVWMAIAYIVCAAGYLLLSQKNFDLLWRPMFHAFAMEPKSLYIIVGLVEALIYTAAGVWLFAALYNQFAKKR